MTLFSLAAGSVVVGIEQHGRISPASLGLFIPPPEFFPMLIAFGLFLGLCAVAGIRVLGWVKRMRGARRTP